ncbi:MAG: hypothetical protein A4E67_01307 [Syntrophaceae bacterium PtaB.Bin038]|nr:MAG: hypothetical protein A4E67_01307 [Syntrophaceae bacterium PtaB.Bin038]
MDQGPVGVHDARDVDPAHLLASEVREGALHLAHKAVQGRAHHVEDVLFREFVPRVVGGQGGRIGVEAQDELVGLRGRDGEIHRRPSPAHIPRRGALAVGVALDEGLHHAVDAGFDVAGQNEASPGVDVDACAVAADIEACQGFAVGRHPLGAKEVLDGEGGDGQAAQLVACIVEQLDDGLHLASRRRVDHDGGLLDPLLHDVVLDFEIEDRVHVLEVKLPLGRPVDRVFQLFSRHLGDLDESHVHLGGGHEVPDLKALAGAAEFPQLGFEEPRELVSATGGGGGDGHAPKIDKPPLVGGRLFHLHQLQGLVADVHTDRDRPLKSGGEGGEGACLLPLRPDGSVGGLFLGRRLRLSPDDVEKFFRGRNFSIGGHAHLLVE